MTDSLIGDRIRKTQEMIQSNPDLQELISKHAAEWRQVQSYGYPQLLAELQPLWNRRNKLKKEEEGARLALLFLAYKMKGMDPEYFTSGAGASSGNCEDGAGASSGNGEDGGCLVM